MAHGLRALFLGLVSWLGIVGAGAALAQTNGYHDEADCTAIAGWAWDASQPTTPISVDIYNGGTLLTSVVASNFRQDLLNAGIGDGNHGFQITTPNSVIDGQSHVITVMYGGTQNPLNNTPKTISCIAPGQATPNYNGYHDEGDCTAIAGWAWDANQPNTPISVDIYDGNTLVTTVSAANFRQDLVNAGIGNGNHGFQISTPNSMMDGKSHTITVKYSGTQQNLNNTPKTLSCTGPGQPTPNYNGYHDEGDCTAIAGWAWDANQPNTPISVDIYDGNTLVTTVPAGNFRQDLVNAGIGNGSHGFQITTPNSMMDGKSHTITVKYSGTQTLLNNTPKTLSCTGPGQPTPNYNGYHDEGDCTAIAGWAWDSNQPTGVVGVDIYDGANKIATVSANQFRQDLLNAGIGNGSHSFQLATPNSVKDGNTHVITVTYAGTQQYLNNTPQSLNCPPAAASIYYIYNDHLGTPRLVTDANNNIVWRYLPTTEPFGNSPPEEDPNSTGNHFNFNLRFPGQYYDKETNLVQNWRRDYDSTSGRYIESDPIGLAGGINTYTYVRANPLRYTDPSGRDPLVAIGAVIGGVAGAVQAANSGGGWTSDNALNIFGGALAGAAIGGAAGLTPTEWGPLAALITGAVAGGGGNLAGQVTSWGVDRLQHPNSCTPFKADWDAARTQAVLGGSAALLGFASGFGSALSVVGDGGTAAGALNYGAWMNGTTAGAAQIIGNDFIPTSHGGFVP